MTSDADSMEVSTLGFPSLLGSMMASLDPLHGWLHALHTQPSGCPLDPIPGLFDGFDFGKMIETLVKVTWDDNDSVKGVTWRGLRPLSGGGICGAWGVSHLGF